MEVKTESEFRALITARVEAAGSQVALARELGVSKSQLGDWLHGTRPISESGAKKLGYERVTVFRRIEGE